MNSSLFKQLGLIKPVAFASTVTYTTVMTKKLDLQRLLSGKKNCWRMDTVQQADSNLKIILTEPTEYIHSEERKKFFEMIYQLLDAGFEIYAWTGKLTPIKTPSDIIQASPQIQPTSSKAFERALIDQNIPMQSLLFVNKYDCDVLTDYIIDRSEDLAIPDWEPHHFNLYQLKDVMNSGLNIETFLLDLDDVDIHKLLQSTHPQHHLFKSYLAKGGTINLELLKLRTAELANIPESIFMHVKEISGSTDSFKYLNNIVKACPNLSYMTCAISDFTSEETVAIINQCKKLVKLNLSSTSFDKFIKSVDKAILKQLKSLNIKNYTNISQDDVIKLLQETPHLQYLYHSSKELISMINKTNLPALLDLKYISISDDEEIQAKLRWQKKCPNLIVDTFVANEDTAKQLQELMHRNDLKVLKLELSEDFEVKYPQQTFIQKLLASGDNVKQLAAICNTAKLSMLALFEVDLSDFTKYLHASALQRLYDFELLSSSGITNLAQLINLCPRLLTLAVNITEPLAKGFTSELNKNALSQLQCLEIAVDPDGQIDSADFVEILNHATVLNELTLKMQESDKLRAIYNHTDLAKMQPHPSIATLKLTNFHSQDSLNALLSKLPNLVHLYIDYCDLPWDTKNFIKPSDLQQLTKLTLGYTNITNNYLAHLLDNCPSLVDIQIHASLPHINANLLGMLATDTFIRLQNQCPDFIYKINTMTAKAEESSTIDSKQSEPKAIDTPQSSKQSGIFELDAPTNNASTHMHQHFYYKKGTKYPSERHDRVSVYNDLILQSDQVNLRTTEKSFIPKNTTTFTNEGLESHYLKHESDENLFLGKMPPTYHSGKAIPLVGLTREDEIIGISLTPPVSYNLYYCPVDNLHYLETSDDVKAQYLTVSYLLKTKSPPNVHKVSAEIDKSNTTETDDLLALQKITFDADGKFTETEVIKKIKQYPLDKRIDLLNKFLKGFTDDVLSKNPTDKIELVNLIIKEKCGSCRHRGVIYKILAHALDIDHVMVVNSSAHMYVEVKGDHGWVTYDLGGGTPAHLTKKKLDPLKQPETSNETAKNNLALDINHGKQYYIEDVESDKDNPYHTWDPVGLNTTTFQNYANEILLASEKLSDGQQNILCVIENGQQEAMHAAFCERLHNYHKNYYYIHDLDDITEEGFFIENDTGKFNMTASRLKEFLLHAKRGDTLIINWASFQPSHIGHNTITETVRLLKNTPIPDGVTIISLLPSHQIMSEDFYSRHLIKSHCPENLVSAPSILPAPINHLTVSHADWPQIDFYTDPWETELTGKIHVHGAKYQWNQSALISAIVSGKPGIILHNAPWDDETFRLFMTELMTQREIYVNGKAYKIPENFQFVRYDHPYSLKMGKYAIQPQVHQKDAQGHYVINNDTVNFLFKRHQVNNQMIYDIPGIIEAYKNLVLPIYITESLQPIQWAQILADANKHQVALHIVGAPDITIPLEMLKNQSTNIVPAVKIKTASQCESSIILTNDIAFKLAEFNMKFPDPIIIQVNEQTTYADLIENLSIKNENGTYQFTHQTSVLAEYLCKSNKNVILEGKISPNLAKQLEPLFSPDPHICLNGDIIYPSNTHLYLVTDERPQMTAATIRTETYKASQYWQSLSSFYPNEIASLLRKVCERYYELTGAPPFNYRQLLTMWEHLDKHPDRNPLKQILRLSKNYMAQKQLINQAWREFHPKDKKITSNEPPIMEKRKKKLLKHIEDSPFLFVVGPSGAGKSSFIREELKKVFGDDLDIKTGMDHIHEWITSKKTHKYLFIDEANLLTPGTLDIFVNLLDTEYNPPKILIDGKYVTLTENHKVIFAGNYGHYEDRQQHRLFSERGNIIAFRELPEEYLKNNIVLSIATQLKIPQYTDVFMEVFKYYHSSFPDKPQITARNLQMMVLRTYHLMSKFEHLNKQNNSELKKRKCDDSAAALAIYDELNGGMNQEQRLKLRQFIETNLNVSLDEAEAAVKEQTQLKSQHFLLTENRINPARILNDLFDIREIKTEEDLYVKGTCGVIFEGEAGEGKSGLARAFLHARNIHPADPNKENNQNHYYRLTPSDPDTIKQQLTKAFHEGAIVIIDEINTIPDIEKLLNAFLSGHDLENKPAKNPGFFIIGTQNPVTYVGRKPLSPALINRFQIIDLNPYTPSELLEIKTHCIQDAKQASKNLAAYLRAKQHAINHDIKPQPTPRDFFAKGNHYPKQYGTMFVKKKDQPTPLAFYNKDDISMIEKYLSQNTDNLNYSESKVYESLIKALKTLKESDKDMSQHLDMILKDMHNYLLDQIKDSGGFEPLLADISRYPTKHTLSKNFVTILRNFNEIHKAKFLDADDLKMLEKFSKPESHISTPMMKG